MYVNYFGKVVFHLTINHKLTSLKRKFMYYIYELI